MALSILIPTLGQVSIEWCVNLRRLHLPEGSKIHSCKGYPIDLARNTLINIALRENASRVLFIDDDVVLPENAVTELTRIQDELMSRSYKTASGLPHAGCVVGGWYDMKIPNFPPGVFRFKNGVYESIKPIGTVMEVDGVVAGALLVHTDVFRAMPPPWFQWTAIIPDHPRPMSEDLWFSTRCREELGITPVCATNVYGKHIATGKIEGGEFRL